MLANSHLYNNQAFRYGNKVYGFQFHIEITKNMLLEWVKDLPDSKYIMKETEIVYKELIGRAINFYEVFFQNR